MCGTNACYNLLLTSNLITESSINDIYLIGIQNLKLPGERFLPLFNYNLNYQTC